jgi:hypothetical protein
MPNKPTKRELLIAVLGLLVIVALIAGATRSFLAESRPSVQTFRSNAPLSEEGITVTAKLLAIDPVKGDLTARLQFEPSGKLQEPKTWALTDDIVLYINSATGKVVVPFKKDERMNPTEVTLSLYNGTVMNYPFDHHEGELYFYFGKHNGTVMNYPFDHHEGELYFYFGKPVHGPDGAVIDYADVPTEVAYTGALAGYSIRSEPNANREPGTVDIIISLARSRSVVFFAVFVMILQWLLAVAAILAVWTWVVRGNRIEVTMFGWMGALLFALIPLRNAMPGAPPVGALSDFLAFFWVLAILAICMFIAIVTWAFYRARPN